MDFTRHRRGLRRTRRLLAFAVALGVALPASAEANTTWYFADYSGAFVRQADTTRSLLLGSNANSSCACVMRAGAHYPGGTTLYASWAVGTDYACHTYGTNNIGAMFESSAYTYVSAVSFWHGGDPDTYC